MLLLLDGMKIFSLFCRMMLMKFQFMNGLLMRNMYLQMMKPHMEVEVHVNMMLMLSERTS